MYRPAGFTILAAIFAWLAFAGLANAVVAAAAPEQLLADGLQPGVIIVSALVYACTAGLTTIGLWRVAPWSGRAAAAWALACDAAALAFAAMFARAGLWPPIPMPLLLSCVVGSLCLPWLLVRYVRRKLSSARELKAPW